jgi:hypothetical protein
MTAPRDVLEPVLDDEAAPLLEGEVVALPVPAGARVTLRFPSAFELYLTRDGRRITDDDGPAARELLLWASRRLPSLWRALGEDIVLLAAQSDGAVVVTDLVHVERVLDPRDDEPVARAEFLDHGALRERLEPCGLALARFSLLGALGTKAELERRVRAAWAPGTLVEVRIEDDGVIVSRRRLRVGR